MREDETGADGRVDAALARARAAIEAEPVPAGLAAVAEELEEALRRATAPFWLGPPR
ncbi:hypothetical protein [Amaricoccus solimangrovi]|uniref:hypothetical protein n=1 Tax=Amaricoccus solimangrovi TaxID=2589815 RepID=UPI0015E3BB1A|nr:hypothetical protein [Amaricoccus solimangrovi]